MATENSITRISIESGADLSTNQYQMLNLDGTLAGAGERGYSLQNKPNASGQAASVAILGVTKVKAGAAFAADIPLTSDGTGRAVTATATDEVVGHSRTAAGAADEIVEMIAVQAGKEA